MSTSLRSPWCPTGPRIVFGCARLSTHGYFFPSRREQSLAFATLDAVAEAGGRTLETAASYSSGGSERIIGAWLAARHLEDSIEVITKGGHPSLWGQQRLDARSLARDFEASRRNLRRDSLPLYLLHRDDPAQTVAALLAYPVKLLREKKILQLGLSNWSTARLAAAQTYLSNEVGSSLAASSPHFSLATWQSQPWGGCVSIAGDAEAREFHTATQLPVIAWSSAAAGFLAGKFSRQDRPQLTRNYFENVALKTYASSTNFERLARLEQLARKLETSSGTLAISYALSQPFPCYPLVSTRHPAHVAALYQAENYPLTPQQIEWLDKGETSR